MPQKTITLDSNAWAVRTEPGVRLAWVPTIGGAAMLASVDADEAVCQNATGAAYDSHSLDAKTFRAGGVLPVFESDARNPTLEISCNMRTGDAKTAAPYVYIFDSADLGGVEPMGPFDLVKLAAWYERVSTWPNQPGNDIFDALASGRFTVSCIFPSRPADASAPSIDFRWNAAQLELTYTYGPNTTPAPFNFVNAAGAVATSVLSNVVVIAGIDAPQVVSIAGHASAVFSVNGDAFSAVARNIAAGQTLQLRMTAPGVVGTFVDCTVTVETRSDAWRVTAGSDVPVTTLGAPANLVNCIPGWIVPDGGVTAGQTFVYQPRGNTVPMPFHFTWGNGITDVQWSTTGAAGPWTDGAVAGTQAVNGNIWIRCRAPNGPSSTGFVRLHYTAADLTDDTTVSTGAAGFIYKVDLSPIDAFEATVAGSTKHWSPLPAGAMHHASVGTSSFAIGTMYATVNSFVNGGRWWRRADTSVMPWPAGAQIKGVDYGGLRSQQYPLAVADAVVSRFYALNPADTTWVLLAGTDAALTNNQTIFLNGGASPGVTPAGWTLAGLLDALKADTFRMGRRVTLKDSSGQEGNNTTRNHVLRVYFEVVKPPEGMGWEV